MGTFEMVAAYVLGLFGFIGLLAALLWQPRTWPDDDEAHGDTTGWKDDK